MRSSLSALIALAISLLAPETEAKHHFDIARFGDSYCSSISLDNERIHPPGHLGMPLKLDKCYPSADKYFKKHPTVGADPQDPDVFHSVAFGWAGIPSVELGETDRYYENCTLFVYERANCDAGGVVDSKWDVDKIGLRGRCWSVGGNVIGGKGARSVMFRCVYN